MDTFFRAFLQVYLMVVSNEWIVGLVLLGLFLLLVSMTRIRVTSSYKAVVKDKLVKHAMDGVFIPVSDYIIITEYDQRVEAKPSTYNLVRIGDEVTVDVYSNGVHMLKARNDPNP